MDRTVKVLEAVHSRLLAEATGPEEAQALMALACSAPQLAGLIETRVPKHATIMRPEDVRELLTRLSCDLLALQASSLRPRYVHRLPL